MLDFEKKVKGAFFTSVDIAHYLTERVIETKFQRILEPSFGDGSFISALIDQYYQRGWDENIKGNLFAVEIREKAIAQLINNPIIDNEKLILGDFLNVEPFPVDIVIGNPPYVGLNKIPPIERDRAQKLLAIHGFNMQSSGSLWLPFIMHSCAFLKNRGTLAFVLPFEITYVRYSRQLWKYLSQHFSDISIIRVFEDIFPDVDVETILFIAKGFGGSTNFVNYEIYETKMDLINRKMSKNAIVPIESITNGERPFISTLLESNHLNVIQKLRSKGSVKPISDFCKFKIGYVCADQSYFHPTDFEIMAFGIDENELIPSIANAKVLKENIGLSVNSNQVKTKLFYPKSLKNKHPYIKYGEGQGIQNRYKCHQRNPWYITPGIETPDVILTVFGDKPRMYVNSGNYLASNSLLCGFITNETITSRQVALSWYNSFTLLSIELRVHSLGGGVLVFIPGETNKVEILSPQKLNNIDEKVHSEIDRLLKNNSLEEAYLLGDFYLLREIGLSIEEIMDIQEAVQVLRKWRNSKLRKKL